MPCIYKITNCVNGKCYVGQTRQPLKNRWQQHKERGKHPKSNYRNLAIYLAMQKYGAENFEIECLQECLAEELDALEIYWIAKLDTFNNGYNLTTGGPTKTVKHVMEPLPIKRPVLQYTLQGEFVKRYDSCLEAANAFELKVSHIINCCKRRGSRSKRGFIFCYEDDVEYIRQLKNKTFKIKTQSGYVVEQYTLSGEFIREFDNASKAGLELGICASSICKCCRGEIKQTNGYIWKYKEQ